MDARVRVQTVLRVFGALTLCLVGILARYQVLGPLWDQTFLRPVFQQRYRGVPVSLARGYILDRHGVPLHYPIWDASLAMFPSELSEPDRVKAFLTESLGIDACSLIGASSPAKIKGRLVPDEVFLVRSFSSSGLEVIPDEIRYGPRALAAHVVGHIRPNENRGESGLESQFQYLLAGGKPSWVGYVATGEGVGLPGSGLRIAPNEERPQDLVTTLDAGVQKIVEEVLDERNIGKGAVVVLDVSAGDILAMASRPSYDQNDPGKSQGDPDAPLVNRAITAFAPGPLWQPVVLSLALEKGVFGSDDVFLCQDDVVVQLCQGLDPDELRKYARECGFLGPTGIPLPGESSGSLADFGTVHGGQADELESLFAGQGGVTATPLQVAAFYRAIACDGLWREPALILGEEVHEVRVMSSPTAAALQKALLGEVRWGTGREAWVPTLGSSGKASTASTQGREPHAWFCGWAPLILPKYVISVFIQEGGDGPSQAAPVFREIAARLLR